MRSPGNWIGAKRGRLTVILEIEKGALIVDCDCGVRKTISKKSFYHIKSCGCLQKERSREYMKTLWKKKKNEKGN